MDFIVDRYVKNTLRIDSKHRLPCFCRYYGVNLEKSLRFNDLLLFIFPYPNAMNKTERLVDTNNIFCKNGTFAIEQSPH